MISPTSSPSSVTENRLAAAGRGVVVSPDEFERHFDDLVEHYVRERQAALRQSARITRRAADTTVEAVRYELLTYGIAQLAKPKTQARLADLNTQQITEMVASLRRMQSRYPAITEELIIAIEELKNE